MVRGSNPGGGEIFRTCPDRPWGPPSLLYNGYRVFPGGKERPGRDADPSPPSSALVMKEKSYTSSPPMGRTACTEPQCLYKGALYLYLTVELYLYSPLWAVRHVQSLSACTRERFTFTLPFPPYYLSVVSLSFFLTSFLCMMSFYPPASEVIMFCV